MVNLLSKVLLIVMAILLIASLVLSLSPSAVDENGDDIYKQLTLKQLVLVFQNAPTIDLDWIEDSINIKYDERLADVDVPDVPPSLNLKELFTWIGMKISTNSRAIQIINDYVLLPIKFSLFIGTLLVNVLIFVGYGFGVFFGFIPLPV